MNALTRIALRGARLHCAALAGSLLLGLSASSMQAGEVAKPAAPKPMRAHWGFEAPSRPTVPPVTAGRVRNPIDNFVLARLDKEGLQPSPEAGRITLLRRLSLDLIGLPPTIEEIDAFVADSSPDAYDKQVERLLGSPHFGERWGRLWLDAARYADSDGFEKDKARQIWAYRDYVIQALNRDVPYDQFIIEQIAGDLLPRATQDQLVATGFLRNSMINEEGGVDPEQFRMEAMFDRMDAIGKSILGLTIQCAQCHDHKYDPLSQKAYYEMFAFLNNTHEASRVVYSPAELMEIERIRRAAGEIEADLKHRTPDWEARMAVWEDEVHPNQPDWKVCFVENAGDHAQRYVYHSDGSLTAGGYAPTKWTSMFRTTNDLPSIGAFRLELLSDPNLPLSGPGRSPLGLCALSEFMVEAADARNPTNKVNVKLVSATADFGNPEQELEKMFDDRSGKRRVTGPVNYAIDGNADTAWGIDAGPGRRNAERRAVFIPEKPIQFAGGAILTFKLQQNHGGWNSDDNQNNNLGRFRFSVTTTTNVVADPIPKRLREVLSVAREKRSSTQAASLFSYWRTTVPEWKEANERIEKLWAEHPVGAPSLTLLAREGANPVDQERQTFMLNRGDWLKPEKSISPGVPDFLHALPGAADSSRLAFAKWLVDRQSPTTARVIVNRIWQAYFGTGLVETPEDLGVRAPKPSHPALLDWLAVELMHKGWKLKPIHRLIVQSAAYRQSSHVAPAAYAKDPHNRWLARGPRLRVDAEIVRDIALAASGLLNRHIGGPSVMPPAPEFLFKPPASYGPKVWNDASGPDRYRRGLYTFRYRSVPYPVLQNFDAPNGDFSCVQRLRSNTPLQALTTLNEVLFMECAQALAKRSMELGGETDEERIAYAFRRCVGRAPTVEESRELVEFFKRQRAYLAEGWVNVAELATGQKETPSDLPEGTTPRQLAAFTALSRVLLNLDETITKE